MTHIFSCVSSFFFFFYIWVKATKMRSQYHSRWQYLANIFEKVESIFSVAAFSLWLAHDSTQTTTINWNFFLTLLFILLQLDLKKEFTQKMKNQSLFGDPPPPPMQMESRAKLHVSFNFKVYILSLLFQPLFWVRQSHSSLKFLLISMTFIFPIMSTLTLDLSFQHNGNQERNRH